jgi:hypothetical protein
VARLFPDWKTPGRNLVKNTLSSFETHAELLDSKLQSPLRPV